MPTLDIKTTPLEGVNLIEASAGTGKTYSIVLLFLRMVLEKEWMPEKILLLTFTEAAANELKDRCRKVIHAALHMAQALRKNPEWQPGNEEDALIYALVRENPEHNYTLLSQAILQLDQADISTIHAFCKKTLLQYAFETGQSFAQTLMKKSDALSDRFLSDYWRSHITNAHPGDIDAGELLKYKDFLKGLGKALDGGTFVRVGEGKQIKEDYLNAILSDVVPKVQAYFKSKGITTFNSMIKDLYDCRTQEGIRSQLQSQYAALLVDEFQDTDVYQYGIFKDIFELAPEPCVFYIGDPKQSIYSFRQADLQVYLDARNSISEDRVWSMPYNYRSTAEMLNRLNEFFRPCDHFHPFSLTADAANTIQYTPVTTPAPPSKHAGVQPFVVHKIEKDDWNPIVQELHRLLHANSECRLNNQKIQPNDIAILLAKNEDCRELKKVLGKYQIPSMIYDESSIYRTDEAEFVCSLMRLFLETKVANIHRLLIHFAAQISEGDLLCLNYDVWVPQFHKCSQTWEQQGFNVALSRVMELLRMEEKWGNHPTVGHRILTNLKQLGNLIQKQADRYHLSREEQYQFLMDEMGNDSDTAAEGTVLQIESDVPAIRIMTFHKSKGLEFPITLVAGLEMENKPIWQRTYFSFRTAGEVNFVLYHKDKTYTATGPYPHYLELYKTQIGEEHRRVVYVALTRAQYSCSLFYYQNNNNQNGAIHPYINALECKGLPKPVYYPLDTQIFAKWRYVEATQPGPAASVALLESPGALIAKLDYKVSYSSLSGGGHAVPPPLSETPYADAYDAFVFHELPRGATVGNMIHEILERIDFTDNRKWEEIIDRILTRYYPRKRADANWKTQLLALLQHLVQVKLPGGNEFSLSDISIQDRVNELDFHFALPDFLNVAEIEQILPQEDARTLQVQPHRVKGLMTGFMDMVFRHKGKYYILDWKTNYLGGSTADYDAPQLLQAMNDNNYHLQYLLYAVALHKYLHQQQGTAFTADQWGGVFYLFVRGIRASEDNGMYFHRPDAQEILALDTILKGESTPQPAE